MASTASFCTEGMRWAAVLDPLLSPIQCCQDILARLAARYKIEDLVEKGDFTDSAYLLLHGELPSAAERKTFTHELTHHTLVHEQLIQFYKGFRHDAHPMAIMVGVVGALAAFYNDARVGAAAEFESV